MNCFKESAAPGKHQIDGPPRLNSSRCGSYYTPAKGLNQFDSSAAQVNTRKPGEKMNQELAMQREKEWAAIDAVVVRGDLSPLNAEQRVAYYNRVCESTGLNPLTKPFDYINLNGKLTLYAKKDCTEQLRKINGVSIDEVNHKIMDDLYIVTVSAKDKTGRTDQSTGAVVLGNLRGDAKANAIMKAETKAKRRVTLSICGIGFTDETEVPTIPNATVYDLNLETGELVGDIKSTTSRRSVEIPAPKPCITEDQANELDMILCECDDQFKEVFKRRLIKTFGSVELEKITIEKFDEVKAALMRNVEKNYSALAGETPVDIPMPEVV